MLLCIKFYPKRQDFTEELEGTKKISKKKTTSKTRAKTKEIRDFTRQQTRRDKFLRENKQFFTPFSKCSASIAVLKIHDKPLPYY